MNTNTPPTAEWQLSDLSDISLPNVNNNHSRPSPSASFTAPVENKPLTSSMSPSSDKQKKRWWDCWKMRTTLERTLFCLLILAGIVLFAIVLVLILMFPHDPRSIGNFSQTLDSINHSVPSPGSRWRSPHISPPFDVAATIRLDGKEEKLCISEACTRAANGLLNAMDQTADPCEDFYAYACGGWLKRNVIPEDKSRYSVFSAVKEDLELTLKRVLEEPANPHEWPATAKAKRMYKACMNESAIEGRQGQPVIDLLEKYVDWPILRHRPGSREADEFEKTFDWVDCVGGLKKDGGTYLINMGVWADSRNTTKQIIYIDQPGVGMPSTEYMLRGKDDRYLKSYFTFMVDTAVLLGANKEQATKEFHEVLDFEIVIAQIKTPRELRRDATRQYNKLTLKELQNRTNPGLDWLKYFTLSMPPEVNPPITASEEVIVAEPEFFNKLLELLNNTTRRTVANYIGWRVVQSVVWDLDTRFREVYNKYRNVLYGTSVEKARWRSCAGVATGYFDMAVGKLYVDDSFKNGSREIAQEMINDISGAFMELLDNENQWMDETAKVVARDKARAISRKVGFPDMITNRTALEEHFKGTVASEEDHFENVHLNSRAWAQKSLRELRDPFDKTKWAATPAEVNAFYSTDYNSITFPAGILQPPFFDMDRPKSMNYGAIDERNFHIDPTADPIRQRANGGTEYLGHETSGCVRSRVNQQGVAVRPKPGGSQEFFKRILDSIQIKAPSLVEYIRLSNHLAGDRPYHHCFAAEYSYIFEQRSKEGKLSFSVRQETCRCQLYCGMVIGHEITHGFDDQGRQKDKDGNLRDWWPSSTVQRFKNKTQCIINQYGGFFVPEVNMTINGVNTQGENIADNGGLKQAYRAYKKWKQRTLTPGEAEPRLPGLAHVSHEQLLFLSYAHIWCGLSRPDAYTNDILSGVHSPDQFRVVGPLRNLVEFSEAFYCPVGSAMNPPIEEKCTVW